MKQLIKGSVFLAILLTATFPISSFPQSRSPQPGSTSNADTNHVSEVEAVRDSQMLSSSRDVVPVRVVSQPQKPAHLAWAPHIVGIIGIVASVAMAIWRIKRADRRVLYQESIGRMREVYGAVENCQQSANRFVGMSINLLRDNGQKSHPSPGEARYEAVHGSREDFRESYLTLKRVKEKSVGLPNGFREAVESYFEYVEEMAQRQSLHVKDKAEDIGQLRKRKGEIEDELSDFEISDVS